MPSHEFLKKPAPLVYIGPERRMKTEQAAMKASPVFGRVMTSAKIVQGLIDRYLDVYLDEITAKPARK